MPAVSLSYNLLRFNTGLQKTDKEPKWNRKEDPEQGRKHSRCSAAVKPQDSNHRENLW